MEINACKTKINGSESKGRGERSDEYVKGGKKSNEYVKGKQKNKDEDILSGGAERMKKKILLYTRNKQKRKAMLG